MRLTSAGAAETVTGSCHLIETRDRRILVDCGVFQGHGLHDLNRAPFPFDPAAVDALLLTHGHNDHCGRIPLLVKRGFRGRIHAIRSTRAITEVILQDSAKIQAEDYERALRHHRQGRPHDEPVEEPLYLPGDVAKTLALFEDVAYDAPLDLGHGVVARFRPAGHILGSAFLEIDTPDGRIVASGDLGNRESALQRDAEPPRECDAVIVETTYGDREHRGHAATRAEFADVLRTSLAAGGNVMIPSFALERTQVVLAEIKALMESGEIPRVPVWLDSPMAARMTRLYVECANEFLPEVQEQLRSGADPFEPDTLSLAATGEESRALNDVDGVILIAGSGMMTGGRILHHLKHNLWRRDSSLVVVGFQAEGTLGRRIVDGAPTVRIHGKEVHVNARVATINGYSAHADRDDLLWWLESTGGATVYMVHGEVPVMDAFAETLAGRGREAVRVVRDRTYEIG